MLKYFLCSNTNLDTTIGDVWSLILVCLQVKIQRLRSDLEEKLMKRMGIVHRRAEELRASTQLQHSQQSQRVKVPLKTQLVVVSLATTTSKTYRAKATGVQLKDHEMSGVLWFLSSVMIMKRRRSCWSTVRKFCFLDLMWEKLLSYLSINKVFEENRCSVASTNCL